MQLQGGRGNHAVIGPSTPGRQSPPFPRRWPAETAAASRMDPTPIVIARCGISSGGPKQRRVLRARHRRKNLDPRARTKRGQRLVEAQMSRRPMPSNWRSIPPFWQSAFHNWRIQPRIRRHAVGQMRVLQIHVHLQEQMLVHVMPVGIGDGCWQADVFIEVESRTPKNRVLPYDASGPAGHRPPPWCCPWPAP